jgi:hypothetical protein
MSFTAPQLSSSVRLDRDTDDVRETLPRPYAARVRRCAGMARVCALSMVVPTVAHVADHGLCQTGRSCGAPGSRLPRARRRSGSVTAGVSGDHALIVREPQLGGVMATYLEQLGRAVPVVDLDRLALNHGPDGGATPPARSLRLRRTSKHTESPASPPDRLRLGAVETDLATLRARSRSDVRHVR